MIGVDECLSRCGITRRQQATSQRQPRVKGNAFPVEAEEDVEDAEGADETEEVEPETEVEGETDVEVEAEGEEAEEPVEEEEKKDEGGDVKMEDSGEKPQVTETKEADAMQVDEDASKANKISAEKMGKSIPYPHIILN